MERAIEHYGKFLDPWKDADPGLPEVEGAEQQLDKITEVMEMMLIELLSIKNPQH
jgi:hypothetical protein